MGSDVVEIEYMGQVMKQGNERAKHELHWVSRPKNRQYS